MINSGRLIASFMLSLSTRNLVVFLLCYLIMELVYFSFHFKTFQDLMKFPICPKFSCTEFALYYLDISQGDEINIFIMCNTEHTVFQMNHITSFFSLLPLFLSIYYLFYFCLSFYFFLLEFNTFFTGYNDAE